jgi:hypothetical protein
MQRELSKGIKDFLSTVKYWEVNMIKLRKSNTVQDGNLYWHGKKDNLKVVIKQFLAQSGGDRYGTFDFIVHLPDGNY